MAFAIPKIPFWVSKSDVDFTYVANSKKDPKFSLLLFFLK